jgi:hypothetical protein
VSSPDLVGLAGRCQLLQPELAHRLQHLVARLLARPLRRLEQAFADEGRDAIEDVDLPATRSGNDRFGRLQREPADEDGQAAEQHLLVGGE